MRSLYIALILTAALACAAVAQSGYRIGLQSINAGGGPVSNGAYHLNSSIGQNAAGFVSGTGVLHWIGFWAGEVPAPTVVGSSGEAKLLSDGKFVSMAGRIATSAVGDFAGYFYLEDPDRASGIRVAVAPGGVPGLIRGSVVNVIGTLSTTADGERQFSGPIVFVVSTAAPLGPIGMPNRSLGGGDLGDPVGQVGVTGGAGLNNIGLLVQTWGRVVAAGTGWVQIDDGSGPVTIDTSTLASPPGQGAWVSVIGISSLYSSGADRLRLVLPRKDSDIMVR